MLSDLSENLRRFHSRNSVTNNLNCESHVLRGGLGPKGPFRPALPALQDLEHHKILRPRRRHRMFSLAVELVLDQLRHSLKQSWDLPFLRIKGETLGRGPHEHRGNVDASPARKGRHAFVNQQRRDCVFGGIDDLAPGECLAVPVALLQLLRKAVPRESGAQIAQRQVLARDGAGEGERVYHVSAVDAPVGVKRKSVPDLIVADLRDVGVEDVREGARRLAVLLQVP
mmetsp:Transcript_2370/g.3417  ORF Transcript_2370/g.3417 Transcript_2370/m.3417 type:complete len:227 (-) Transcript_2370:711-1391(-)